MNDYATALGGRLRAVRRRQGLTLHGVELKSGGRWNAAAVGAYERGERALSVQKLADLLDFYGVPIAECFPESRAPSEAKPSDRINLDLTRLRQLSTQTLDPLVRFVAAIQGQRGTYDVDVLTIRSADLRTLSIMYDITLGGLTDRLNGWGLLLP